MKTINQEMNFTKGEIMQNYKYLRNQEIKIKEIK